MEEEIRVRVAPSPTGKLHFGTARTALLNFLYAKKFNGKFILRIEDTDQARNKPEYEVDIIEGLKWLGLYWEEGPDVGGSSGPYRQSERMDTYQPYINKLVEDGKAYKCYCTTEELDAERAEQEKKHQPPRYSGKCRNLTKEQIEKYEEEGRKFCIRFKVDEDETFSFKDIIRGKIEVKMKEIGDFTIVASDGKPLFLIANTIDDALMKITHVLRGEDHISNTPKNIKLMEAMNFLPPEYGHFPMILNPDRTKLSKRKNPTSITDDFKVKGYLPEAMINFMILMGWSPGDNREIFGLKELETEFSIERVGKSPAIFDISRLDFLNGYYIRQLQIGDLAERCLPFLEKYNKGFTDKARNNPEYYLKTVALIQERLKHLDEIGPLTHFFYKDVLESLEYDTDILVPKGAEKATVVMLLERAMVELQETMPFDREGIEKSLRSIIGEFGIKAGDLLWPVRVAITGEKASPGVFEVLEVLGQERSVKRISDAIERLEGVR